MWVSDLDERLILERGLADLPGGHARERVTVEPSREGTTERERVESKRERAIG